MSEDLRSCLFGVAVFLFMIFCFPRDVWREVFEITPPSVQVFMKPYIGEWLKGKNFLEEWGPSSTASR